MFRTPKDHQGRSFLTQTSAKQKKALYPNAFRTLYSFYKISKNTMNKYYISKYCRYRLSIWAPLVLLMILYLVSYVRRYKFHLLCKMLLSFQEKQVLCHNIMTSRWAKRSWFMNVRPMGIHHSWCYDWGKLQTCTIKREYHHLSTWILIHSTLHWTRY